MADSTIKGLRKKEAAGKYDSLIPIGADGKNIDMLSGLDLEKELKLGGDHQTQIISQEDGSTIIKEDYIGLNNLDKKYYEVVTTIYENGKIEQVLYWVDTTGDQATYTLVRRKAIKINDDAVMEVIS